ncbi:hypothetical protein [Nonomuraea jiangxiensis]|uniref:LGFP repeat-containing protein n=1 Tax=Nonomuraea jiangxiensis TaxID=633440 RepID=A0A1G8Q575_9ACTN|nr:hypothetical protein [Nonomuraea jiangxiensis]SDI99919.1 hypothetical protein SAMN05421869_108133 [Nonomuraea jiangxiensis]
MNRRFLSRAAVAALAVMATGLLAAPVHAATDPTPTPKAPGNDLSIAWATVACDPRGTTAADAAAASRLNGVLQGRLRGYMTAYRVSCARMVIKAVQDRDLNTRAATIAITTTIVESNIENISEMVDHTSLGLFQQQDNWGSREQRLNPAWATNAFLDKMIRKYPGNAWMTAPIGEVCQAVQVSSYPTRYQEQAADGQRIVNEVWPLVSAPVTAVEGRLYREPSGTIAVIAGGAPVRFASMDELAATGYGSAPLTAVPAGWLNRLPQEPRDGTFLRDAANGAISVIAGGAKYGLTLAEWEAMGRPGSINVPLRVINEYGRVPADGTLLRNHTDGAISVVAGGAKYGLSLAQWERLGKPASVNVPIGFINTLGSDPRPGTFLRDVANGSIYLTIGGAKYGLTWAEYERLGYPGFANVPIEWINTFRAIPRDGSYLRNVEDGTIYVMTGGKKDALTYEEWDRLGKPASTNVPVGFLNQIPNA